MKQTKIKDKVQFFNDGEFFYTTGANNNSVKIKISEINDISKFFEFVKNIKIGLSNNDMQKYLDSNISAVVLELLEYFKKFDLLFKYGDRDYLDDIETQRYTRQLNWLDSNITPHKGKNSDELQKRIFNYSVCVVGLGSLGSSLIMQLAAFGIRNFILIDKDHVEISNLNRQFLYNTKSIGKKKVDVAENWLKSFDRKINITKYATFIESEVVLKKVLDGSKIDLLVLTADEPKGFIVDLFSMYCKKQKINWFRFSRVGFGPLYSDTKDSCSGCLLPRHINSLKTYCDSSSEDPRKRDCIPHVRNIEHPTDHSLNTHSEGCMWYATDLMDITDEFKTRIAVLALIFQTLIEHLKIRDLLSCSKKFTVTIASNQIRDTSDSRIILIDHIWKRLD